MSEVNWTDIRADYEGGMSLRALAAKHGASKTYIIEKRDKEQWNRPTTSRPPTDRPHTPMQHLPLPADALSIARIGLSQLAQHLQADDILSISSHKSLSDALAQYVKVLVIAPRETEVEDGLVLPLEKLLPSTRMEIRRLLAEDKRKQQERTG